MESIDTAAPVLRADKQERRFETLQLHGGKMPDIMNSCAVPVYETAAFAFNDSAHGERLLEFSEHGNIYSRIGNPTVTVFQNRMAALEGGVAAVATASGTAAVTMTLLALAGVGDNIVAAASVHGGTYHMLKALGPRLGIECHFVETNDPRDYEACIDSRTKFVLVETISNPKYEVPDFEALAGVARQNGIPLVCDNTFGCGGFVCRPIYHGVDIVIHSATKWIGGHGTTLGGVIIDAGTFDWGMHRDKFPQFHANDSSKDSGELSLWQSFGNRAFAMRAQFEILRDVGSCMSASSAQQLLLGLESLTLRCERSSHNSAVLAAWLERQPQVAWVSYLGTKQHPSHENAQKYLRFGYGSVLSFGIRGGKENGFKLCDSMKLIMNCTNLGDSKTLVVHPWTTTHQQLTDSERYAAGVTEDHIRMSVGIEHVEDIKDDLRQAFDEIDSKQARVDPGKASRYKQQREILRAMHQKPLSASVCV